MNGQLPLIRSPIDRPFNRVWAMPSSETFSIPPIRDFIWRHMTPGGLTVDPFARNSPLADPWSNDLNPNTHARHHMDALEFLSKITVLADLVLFDPPYSPRQIQECYNGIGKAVTSEDTNRAYWTPERDAIRSRVRSRGKVLSFGWNSVGMGIDRGFKLVEILLVCHGGAHNDTICIAEEKQ